MGLQIQMVWMPCLVFSIEFLNQVEVFLLLLPGNTFGRMQIENRVIAATKLRSLVQGRQVTVPPTGGSPKRFSVAQHDKSRPVLVLGT